MSKPSNVWILGGYQTDFARNLTREGKDFADLATEVVDGTLAASGVDAEEIGVVHVGNAFGQLFAGQGQLGAMPAWQVPGENSTWVLFVHGIDGLRQSALRPLPQVVDAGLPALVITYRNDAGAPSSPNGLISLGETEWNDLESAAAYAIDQGAERFVLYGDSMGGSIVTQFMHRSEYADRVVGMVLDAPVLNWAGVLQNQADRLHFGAFGGLVQLAVQWRGGIDLGVLDELDQTQPFEQLPILLFQGLADPLVPHAESEQFADSVANAKYVPVPGAGHIQSWNVDPASYAAKLAAFLAQFGG